MMRRSAGSRRRKRHWKMVLVSSPLGHSSSIWCMSSDGLAAPNMGKSNSFSPRWKDVSWWEANSLSLGCVYGSSSGVVSTRSAQARITSWGRLATTWQNLSSCVVTPRSRKRHSARANQRMGACGQNSGSRRFPPPPGLAWKDIVVVGCVYLILSSRGSPL